MPHQDRRAFLAGIGASAFAPGLHTKGQDPSRSQVQDLAWLAETLRTVPRDEALAKAVALHRDGTTWRDLLGAAFLAGVRDVEPRPVGFQFHCVLMTASAFRIAEASPPEDRLLAALFQIDDLKRSQDVDLARRGDWTLPAAPKVDGGGAEAAAAAAKDLLAALRAWDGPAADRAATALARSASLDEAFAPLWEHGAADFTNIGHKPIFVAQAHRTLQQIGWRFGEDVLRSLAHGLLDGRRGSVDVNFAANRERATKLRADWPHGAPSEKARNELAATLRTADAGGAADAVVELVNGGAALASVFDALRLAAAEQVRRIPGILSVHALTGLDALRYAFERARDDAARRTLLLQAASWQVLYRDALRGAPAYAAKLPPLETVEPAELPPALATAEATFARAAEDPRAAEAQCLAAAAAGGLAPFVRATNHFVVRKALEHHDVKFAAAVLDESAAASPDTAARLFAAATSYLRGPADVDAEWLPLVRG